VAHSDIVVSSEGIFLVCELAVFGMKSKTLLYPVRFIIGHTYSVECKRSSHRIIQHPCTEKEAFEKLNSILELAFLLTQHSKIVSHMAFLLNIAYLDTRFSSHLHVLEAGPVQILGT